jgi:hypothetical protein
MPLEIIKVKTVSSINALKFKKQNYVVWLESTSDVFLYAGILKYVLYKVPRPVKGNSDLPIWTKNDKLAQAGIHMNLLTTECDYLCDQCTITSTHDIWIELKKHHRQKAST